MRPIDADAITYTMLYKENWFKGTGREELGVWKKDIDKLPTIEPKRGQWLEKKDFMYCSECAEGFDSINMIDFDFCPNCGAKMERDI